MKEPETQITLGDFPNGATGYDPDTQRYTWDEPEEDQK